MRDFEFLVPMMSSMMVLSLTPFLLLGLAIPYAVLRMREGKTGDADPQIGVKTVLHYFCSAGILMVLVGLTIILVDLFMREDRAMRIGPQGFGPRVAAADDSEAIRTGVAVMVTGFAFAVLHGLLLTGTNDRTFPAARRAFTGTRLAIHGLVVLFCLTMLIVMLVQPRFDFRTIKPFLATLLVWGPSWVIHLVLLIAGTPRLKVTRESLGLDHRDDDDR